MFESLEITVNHESLHGRSSDAEYFLTDHLMTNLVYDSGVIERGMKIKGFYDSNNFDSVGITDQMKIERGGNLFVKNEETFRKYNFIMPINHGIAREGKLLPPNSRYRYFKLNIKNSKKEINFEKNKF